MVVKFLYLRQPFGAGAVRLSLLLAIGAAASLCAIPSRAQQQQQQQQQQQPQPQPQQQQQPPAESGEWAKLPRMQLERQFAGPLQDTIVQRWRDPVDGTVCYIYLPITAAHTPPTPTGFVQYGANTIGSLSCLVEAARPPARAEKRPTPEKQ
jgi:hypothetical protein